MIYSIDYQTEDIYIGKDYPQAECQTLVQAHSLNAWEFPNPEPKMVFNLAKRAKLTDVLSNAAINARGFLINKKAKDIFDKFNLIKHKYYEVIINSKNESLAYYWLHLCEPELIHCLDYSKSVFYRTEYTFRQEEIKIASYKEYEDKKKLDTDASFGIELDLVHVNEQFNKDLDLFTFIPFDSNVYISERFKNIILNSNITGINLIEAPNINI